MNQNNTHQSNPSFPHDNPLLDYALTMQGFAPFDRIQAEHVQPAVQASLEQAQEALQQVLQCDFPANWQVLSATLDVAIERLGTVWGIASHLSNVVDTPALRQAYHAALPLVSQFWAELGANEALYAKYKAIDPVPLPTASRQALEHVKRDLVLSGAELQGTAKERFTKIQEELATLAQTFSENTLDATDAFVYYASEAEVAGLPQDVLQAARKAAQADDQSGYKLCLKQPVYVPVMQFAQDRSVRERLFRAYTTRASEFGPKEQNNGPIMERILALRQEEAALLGFPSYAHYSLATKMADTPELVEKFLLALNQKAKPYALADAEKMRKFASTELGLNDPQPWDWAFIGERLKEAEYAFSDQEVKAYFQLPKVLEGLFSLIDNLYGVQFRPSTAPVWHTDVQFYELRSGTDVLAHFYLDPTARTGKRGGAWMDNARDRWLRPDGRGLQTPVAYLVCNFASQSKGAPALLTHDDVITLFHEMGHGLHHMLTAVKEPAVGGINGVEWDAVELPSQFMENFAWEKSVLQGMSSQVDSGAKLSDALYAKMLKAKNFQSGLQTLRQVEFSLFDMLLHSSVPDSTAYNLASILDLQRTVRAQTAVLPVAEYNRFAHTFSHIFAGGYAAGYYGYKWAEVLSADAYSAFEEGALARNPEAYQQEMGAVFLREVLKVGATRPALESFTAFRGRDPSIDALLRHQGMVQEATAQSSH